MVALVSVGTGNSGGDVSAVTPVLRPIVAGQHQHIYLALDSYNVEPDIPDTPEDWHPGGQFIMGNQGGLWHYWRKLVGGESNPTFNFSSSQAAAWLVLQVSDVNDWLYAGAEFHNTSSPQSRDVITPWDSTDILAVTLAAWNDGTSAVVSYPTTHPDNHAADRWDNTGGTGIACASRNFTGVSDASIGAWSIGATEHAATATFLFRQTSGGGPVAQEDKTSLHAIESGLKQ